MTNNQNLVVTITTPSPQEFKGRLIRALANATKWYAVNPNKTTEDEEHICTLAHILEAISE